MDELNRVEEMNDLQTTEEMQKRPQEESMIQELDPEERVEEDTPKSKSKRGRKKPKEEADATDMVSEEYVVEKEETPDYETAIRKKLLREKKQESLMRQREAEEKRQFLSIFSSLRSAKSSRTLLRGIITGAEEILVDQMPHLFLTLIYEGKIKILIPFAEVYRDNPIKDVDTSTANGRKEYIQRQKAMAEKLYGVETPFIITNMEMGEEGDYSIAASRRKALEIIEKVNFEPDPATGVARLEEGTFVNAPIISVGNFGLTACIGGIDTQLSVYQLTHAYIGSAQSFRQKYKVGDILKLQIRSIKKDEKGRRHIVADGHPAELLDAKQRQGNLLTIGSYCIGTITNITQSRTKSGYIIVRMFLDNYNMPAITNAIPPSKAGTFPMPGDKARVQVQSFKDDGMVIVVFRGFHGSPNFSMLS